MEKSVSFINAALYRACASRINAALFSSGCALSGLRFARACASRLNRVFDLRPGDFVRALPLFAYYLLIVSFYMMSRVARDAIFLDRFSKEQLPYADMSVALLSAFIVAPYIRAGYRASLRNLQMGSLLFFAANLGAFWWGFHFHKWTWLSAAFYVWVGICGILSIAQVWTLANFAWTTREAKRLFALLGSGGIIGGSLGGFLAKWVAEHLGTDATLLFMAAFLLICVVLIWVICRQNRMETAESRSGDPQERPRNLMDSFRLVRQSPHLLAISALILLSSVVTTVCGWQLKAIAKDTLVQKDMIAAYLGAVAGYTGIASLVAQLLITTKLIRRYGVGIALLVLPLSLTFGSLTVLVFGTLWAAAVLRGSDGVFRYSIDTSAVQLLYLPVPASIKVQVKSFIDTVIWKFGDGLAAITLLVFATRLHFTPQRISWVSLVLLAAWITAAFVARNQYVATLKANIQQVRIQPERESVPVLDHYTTNVFAEKLNSSDPNEVMYALTLFEMGQQLRVHSAVRNLLNHPSAHVRRKTVSILNSAADLSVRQQVASMVRDNDLEVRTEALRYLSRHDELDPLTYVDQPGDFADFTVRSALISFLMRPGEGQNVEAARMILDGLIADLATPELAPQAANSIALLGDTAVDGLKQYLADTARPLEIRKQIPGILSRIGTSESAVALAENIVQVDGELRLRIISALNKLCEERGNLPVDRQLIESAMLAEMMGHYRSYQILATQNGEADETIKRTMNEELERIFRLMKLLFPTIDLQNAYLGVQSTDPVKHANALEFLDNTLNSQLRTRLVPLIDSEVTFQERVRLADRFLGFSVQA
jgi:ATP/ADP translocase